MGIRVNKVLGYGLTDVKTEGYEIVDERIDPLGFAMSRDYEEEIWSLEGFRHYWKCHDHEELSDRFLFEMMMRDYEAGRMRGTWRPPELCHCVEHDAEFGDPKILLITPPSMHSSWHRYDDDIDYHEETECHNQNRRYVEMPWGIYPWNGIFMKPDGTRWTQENGGGLVLEFMRSHGRIVREDFVLPVKKEIEFREQLARRLGFVNFVEALDNVLPLVPEEVQQLCRYLNLFNDDETIYHLRPMLYVYWR